MMDAMRLGNYKSQSATPNTVYMWTFFIYAPGTLATLDKMTIHVELRMSGKGYVKTDKCVAYYLPEKIIHYNIYFASDILQVMSACMPLYQFNISASCAIQKAKGHCKKW